MSPIKKPIFDGTNTNESSQIEVKSCDNISSTTDTSLVKSTNEKQFTSISDISKQHSLLESSILRPTYNSRKKRDKN